VNETDDSQADIDGQSFLSMLVHELRTPLTALRGSLGLLTCAVESAAPEVRSFAAIADRNADRLASMLDDVAEYWRLNDPSMLLNRGHTDIADTVQRAIEQVQALIDERGIVLDVQTTPAGATIDPALVRTAVARLLSYALRVSPTKSTLHVRIETVDSAAAATNPPAPAGRNLPGIDAAAAVSRQPSAEDRARPEASIVVSVSDGGRVVAAESASRMFEPFSAVARGGAEQAMRPGLGLAIALRIATLHRGSLVFASTEHGGLFSLRLPV
jgi:signal transduction histidine kinase